MSFKNRRVLLVAVAVVILLCAVTISGYVLLLIFFDSTDFMSFGPEWDTTSPTAEQRTQVLTFIGLDSADSNIEVLGAKFLGSGIDDAVWLKFRTSADYDPFADKPIENSRIETYPDNQDSTMDWWNPNGKSGLRFEYAVSPFQDAGVFRVEDGGGYVWYVTSNER